MKRPNSILKLTLIYTLQKAPINVLNNILIQELILDEKLEVLLSFNDDRIKNILINLGVKSEFIDEIHGFQTLKK